MTNGLMMPLRTTGTMKICQTMRSQKNARTNPNSRNPNLHGL